MALTTQRGQFPHTLWIDLKGDGLMTECAVVKQDDQGNIHYFELGLLDAIDKARLARILLNRNAATFPLWDLMSQTTLKNGVNALTYFHQLVKVISAAGLVYTPRGGVMGTGRIDTNTDNANHFENAKPSITDNK